MRKLQFREGKAPPEVTLPGAPCTHVALLVSWLPGAFPVKLPSWGLQGSRTYQDSTTSHPRDLAFLEVFMSCWKNIFITLCPLLLAGSSPDCANRILARRCGLGGEEPACPEVSRLGCHSLPAPPHPPHRPRLGGVSTSVGRGGVKLTKGATAAMAMNTEALFGILYKIILIAVQIL